MILTDKKPLLIKLTNKKPLLLILTNKKPLLMIPTNQGPGEAGGQGRVDGRRAVPGLDSG